MSARPALVVLAGAAAVLGLWAADVAGLREAVAERAHDAALARLAPLPADPKVVVVDIDRESLAKVEPWPWRRERLAELTVRIADAGAVALAFDVLFAEPDGRSPAALARALETAVPGRVASTEGLTDGDRAFAEAAQRLPTAFGFVLDPDTAREPIPTVPLLAEGRPDLSRVWEARGLVGPTAALHDGAAGMGALALPVDGDGRVRRVPLLVRAGASAAPGLAVEAIRLGERAETLIVAAVPPSLQIGARRPALPSTAMLRLVPPDEERPAFVTLPAADVLAGRGADRLAGAVVLVGGSAPELGGLRATASGPATPSVAIHAAAVVQMRAGIAPVPPARGAEIEVAAALVLALLAALAGGALRPLAALGGGVAVAIGVLGAGAWLAGRAGLLVDLAGPTLVGLAVLGLAVVVRFVVVETRERRLRRRFEQHLDPAVVARLAADPTALRLDGEERVVTALFTDVEGFTAMTERAEPKALVAALDAYFALVSDIVVDHGGLIDKFVGDAVHAVFNAPLDLPDHATRALDAAEAILVATARFRTRPEIAALGFGRTRIGIETGSAIVGDVGGGRKLDYTAHGTAVNTAARLEAANKRLGTSILVGPGAAAAIDPARLRPVGAIDLAGRTGEIAVFTPAEPQRTEA